MDVLLVNPPLSYLQDKKDWEDDVFGHHPPLGYLYLASVLRNNGIDVGIIDVSTRLSLEAVVKVVIRKKPKIVGISAVTANMRGAYQLASEIKKKTKALVVLGGHHVSCDPDVVNRHRCFDIGITGEAEITFPKIVKKILGGRKITDRIVVSELPRNLDKIPLPARDLINFNKNNFHPVISLLSSRGCPYQCVFCSRPAVSKIVRFRNPKLVVDEMEEASAMVGNDEFVFQDDTFNMSDEHVMGICEEIINRKLAFKWTAYGRFNLVKEGVIKMMSKAGCKKFMFGVESGNNRVRNEIVKKAVTDDQIWNGIKICWKHNIEPDVFLMLGFPTETISEINDTVNFGRKFLPNMLGVHTTRLFPGSDLWKMMEAQGFEGTKVIDDYITGKLGERFNKIWPKYIPAGMTVEMLAEAQKKAHRSFYLSPKYVLMRLKRDIGDQKKIKEDLKQATSIFRFGASYAKRDTH